MTTKTMNNAIVHFVIGSTPLVTFFIYFILYIVYHRLSDDEKEESKIQFSTLVMILPPLYGILFALLYFFLGMVPEKNKDIHTRFILAGALSATIVSLILDYVYNIYAHWFHIDNTGLIHIGTFIFYFLFYYTIGEWLRTQILYGPTDVKPTTHMMFTPPVQQSTTGIENKFDQLAQRAAASKT